MESDRDRKTSGVLYLLRQGPVVAKLSCVPCDEKILKDIMTEAHDTSYMFYHGSTKMYQDLKGCYWWPWMKKDIANSIS